MYYICMYIYTYIHMHSSRQNNRFIKEIVILKYAIRFFRKKELKTTTPKNNIF